MEGRGAGARTEQGQAVGPAADGVDAHMLDHRAGGGAGGEAREVEVAEPLEERREGARKLEAYGPEVLRRVAASGQVSMD